MAEPGSQAWEVSRYMSLSAEKQRILQSICTVLGEEGLVGQPLPVSLPPLEQELSPYIAAVESLELHLGIPSDRTNLKRIKQLSTDLYLPGRDLSRPWAPLPPEAE